MRVTPTTAGSRLWLKRPVLPVCTLIAALSTVSGINQNGYLSSKTQGDGPEDGMREKMIAVNRDQGRQGVVVFWFSRHLTVVMAMVAWVKGKGKSKEVPAVQKHGRSAVICMLARRSRTERFNYTVKYHGAARVMMSRPAGYRVASLRVAHARSV